MKKLNILLFCTLALFSIANAQIIQLEWTKPVQLPIGDFFHAGDRLATLVASPWPDETYFIRTFSFDGDSLDRFTLPGAFYPVQACYNAENQCIYVVGTNPTKKFAMLVKMLPDGTIAWTKSESVATYPAILGTAVESQGDKVLLGFFVGGGPTNAVGYFLFDTSGNMMYQSEPAVAPSSLHEAAHRMKFDHAGNVIAVPTPTNFGEWIRMIKFDGLTGQILWTKPNLALPLYGTTDSNSDFVMDEADNIYFSGHCNRIIKLNANGDILYNMPVDADNYKIIYTIAQRGDYILLIGSWKTIPDNIQLFSSGTYLAAVYAPTGAVQWQDYGTQENYVFFSGIWASDTVLYTGALSKYILPQTVVKASEPITTVATLTAWPNPSADGAVWLDPGDLTGTVQVYNALGQLVVELKVSGSPVLLRLPAEAGIYQAVLKSKSGPLKTVRLLR